VREKRNAYREFVGNPEGKRQLGKLVICGSVIFKWILEEWGWEDVDWLSLNWTRTGGRLVRIAVSLVCCRWWKFCN
jgi:hypothetical protein